MTADATIERPVREGGTDSHGGGKNERRTAFSAGALSACLIMADAAVTMLAGLAGTHDLLSFSTDEGQLGPFLLAVVSGTAILILLFRQANLYGFEQISHPTRHLRRIIPAVALAMLLLLMFAFTFKLEFIDFPYARVWLFSWFAMAGTGIIVVRMTIRRVVFNMSRSGQLCRNVAVVGSGEQAMRLLRYLRSNNEPWNNVVGIFDDRTERAAAEIEGHQRRGTIDDLVEFVRSNAVDDIIVALPWSADNRVMEIIRRLDELPVNVRLGSDLVAFAFPRANFNSFSGVPVLELMRKPLSGWRSVVKAAEDKIITGVATLLLSPVLAAVALAVRLDSPGPVIFRQPRYGFNNQVFHVYKFRSMYHNRPVEAGTPQAIKNDPRITRVGAFIRRTSLDELPQLFNVLEGTMSLVGPRPHAVAHNELYGEVIERYFARHKVKPGITGWAQVNGLRGETDTDEKMQARVEHDIHYIDNWSLWFDLKILVKTALVVFFQKTAY